MGIERGSVGFLVASQRVGVDFAHTLTLGRQSIMVDRSLLRAGFADGGVQMTTADAKRLVASSAYAEPLLHRLGASQIDSMDVSAFEGATIVHDLNEPLPAELRARFSLVFDGGTLEHVFNYPAALRNALESVRLGGHFISITPANGYVGHVFYQLSPELFYRVLAPANGFRTVCMLLKAQHWNSRWRSVPDPVSAGGRVVWCGAWPTQLYVLSQRVAILPVLAQPTLQSDYVAAWETPEPAAQRPRRFGLPAAITSRLPLAVREMRGSTLLWRASRSPLPIVKLTNQSTFEPR